MSDILSPDDQQYLFKNLGAINVDEVAGNIGYSLFSEGEDQVSDPIIIEGYKTELDPTITPAPVAENVLTNEEYTGPYNFEVLIDPNGSKNAWVYSVPLNKVYMNMKIPFPVDFRVHHRPDFQLYIRTTPVYSAPQFAHENVYRCINHEFAIEEVPCNVPQHIIRCNNRLAEYDGDKTRNERLSVVIPFAMPQTGTDNVREMFEFVCKNSCPMPGMNRRAIEVIFTLEDMSRNIYGRQVLNVRVCSCPKRDKEKDEKEYYTGKLKPPQGKKRKMEKPDKKVAISSDNEFKEYFITIPIVGRHNAQQLLKYSHDLMAGEVVRRANNGTDIPFKKCLSKINAKISQYHHTPCTKIIVPNETGL
nr:unnamed protein product [Callosobruchus chinensis]